MSRAAGLRGQSASGRCGAAYFGGLVSVASAATITVAKDKTPVMDGSRTATYLDKGVTLTVEKKQGNWYGVKVLVDGKPLLGWVHKTNVSEGAADEGKAATGPWPPAEFTNSLGMQFVRIPAGEFLMGTPEAWIQATLARNPDLTRDLFVDQVPVHKVRLTKAFLMAKYEVTVGQFRKFLEATGYKTDAETGVPTGAFIFETTPQGFKKGMKSDASWRKPYLEQTDAHPVVCVSWNDAKKFVEWLNANDKSRPAGSGYRLPTEAEWEYAAAGPKSFDFPWGNNWDGKQCNFASKGTGLPWDDQAIDDGFPRTAPVGSFSPKGDSPFGVCDMAGNVAEWCEDWLGPYERGDQTDPKGPPSGEYRVFRGGSWACQYSMVRCADRRAGKPERPVNFNGFRVVLASGD